MPTVDEEILGLKTRYRKENNLDLLRAIIGTADGTVVDSTAPGFIWVRLQTSNGLSAPRRVMGPAGKAMSLQAGAAVNLEYDKMGQLRIAEPDNLTVIAGGSNPIAQVVQPTTTTTPRLTQGSIETLRVIPASPASLIVAIKGWNPIVSGTPYQFAGVQVDLTSYVPSAGNMRYAVIFVKADYATTEVFASTARSTADVPLDAADIQECITAATAGSTPVWAIKLVGGQTAISQNDIDVDGVDLRQMVNTTQGSGTGNVSGPGSSTDRAFATWNGTGGIALYNNTAMTSDSGGNATFNSLSVASASTTISSDAASLGSGFVVLSAQTGTSDDLATLTTVPNGRFVCLQAAGGHTITVKHGIGNIFLNGGADFVLSGDKTLLLFSDGTNWSDTGAGGGSGAPTTATYITQTPDAGLSAEQALSALATGYVKNTTGTGVLSVQAVPIPEADGGTARTTGAATKALDNLASVAVNTTLVSDTDVIDDLGSAAIRWNYGYIKSIIGDVTTIPVKNVSGATANNGEMGVLSYDASNGYSYNTTTTANLEGTWCVVVIGGVNNATIYVARRGQVTVKLNANCAIGNFLLTSTTAGQASVSTTMRPQVFAVALSANAGGAGGTCTAMLLTNTRFVPATNANNLYEALNVSTSAFVATINGAPSATSVVYNAPSSGAANVIVPNTGTLLLKARLWNTTRNSYRLITAVNTGTSTITTVSSTDSWATGDTITIESQTVTTGAAYKAIELDLSQQTVIPALARALFVQLIAYDSTTAGSGYAHPYETYALSKSITQSTQVAGLYNFCSGIVPVIARVVCAFWLASGAGTGQYYLRPNGYFEATS